MNAAKVHNRIPREAQIDRDKVYKALLSLQSKGMVLQPSKGQFKFKFAEVEAEGILEYTKKGDAYLLTGGTEQFPEDIFIPKEFLNRGLPGDRVAVTVLKGGRRPQGRVVKVISHSDKKVVGTLDVFERTAFLIPDKNNYPFDIKITGNIKSDWDGMKAVAVVTGFPENARNPQGRIEEILGKPGFNDTEMHAIVAEFGFSVAFPEDVEKEAQKYGTEVNPAEYADRRDMRKTLTFTIDPADAKDFDDAISFEILGPDRFEIGVHIADVAHYVRPGSALDREALLRGTSVYLADRTIPMLPENLSNHLCSLKPNVDRLAFSAIFEMNGKAQVLNEWFGKTVIHSDFRFSYEQAQEQIVTGKGNLKDELTLINNLARKLTEARKKEGAMGFETEEIRFKLDEKGKPVDIYIKKRFDAHKLIEEFMLLANKHVAKYVKLKQKPELPFIYRSHDAPPNDKLIELAKFCKLFGYQLDISTEKNLRKSMNALLEQIEGKPEESVLQQSAIRSMAKAVYTGARSDHFGLAFDYYTHFTSPIRRYPDLLAHRMLFHYLKKEQGGYSSDQIEHIAKHSSSMEQKAAEAERASTKYKMAEYIQQFEGQTFDAVVSGLTEWGIFAIIIDNHCEGMIRISDMRGDKYEYIESRKIVMGKRTRRAFHLGDTISIRVKNANPQLRNIDFTLADY